MVFLKRHVYLMTVGTGILIFVWGVFIGILIPLQSPLFLSTDGGIQVRSGQVGFTNPLLECDISENSLSARKEDFTPELTTLVNALLAKKKISEVAVYYRDLNNGPVSSVGSSKTFIPASLLKVPVMMTILHESESKPSILDEKIVYEQTQYTKQLLQMQTIAPSKSIVLGHTYTVRELIEYMIKYSDNEAMALLYERIPISEQIDLYSMLGVDPSVLMSTGGELTVKQYSVFFRILFNASYLSRSNSEYALKLLSETEFNDGIRAGVPANIVISHKFGERKLDTGLQQLHDCGIVYYPNHPYLLCMMSRGTDTSELASSLSDISTFVYNKIDGEYGKR